MDEKDEGESVGGIEAVLKSVADTENEIFEFATHEIDLDASMEAIVTNAIPVVWSRSLERESEELDRRIGLIRSGVRPDWASRSDRWFAWRPVFTGALGTGPVRWLKWVYRNRCCGVTIYQDI